MKFAIALLCLLGTALANPILHKVATEMMEHTSNSTSSVSESSEESNTSEHDSSPENTSENTMSESAESVSDDQTSDMSQSHSLEDQFGTGEAGMTADNSQGSLENMRKKWVHLVTVKLGSEEERNSTEDHSSSESTESQEKQTHSSTSTESNDKDSRLVVDSSETSESRSSNSSSSDESRESSQSTESTESTESKESHSKECPPEADSDECDSDEYKFHDIGDDGASEPFNGFRTPDNNEHEVVFKR